MLQNLVSIFNFVLTELVGSAHVVLVVRVASARERSKDLGGTPG